MHMNVETPSHPPRDHECWKAFLNSAALMPIASLHHHPVCLLMLNKHVMCIFHAKR